MNDLVSYRVYLKEAGDNGGNVVFATFGVGGTDQLLTGGFQTAGQLKD